ncbi:hypothetical protein HaLaN_05266 [Haematococcus lacustris]|uniref:Uncharacterized protein n=1 Tax=Haematococcus lacustris TaxID=44745 RepID=A0A699YT90_HAELA|nr:hypothetical protein HaLaN_05266 [Haematococcus lacustris]
MDLCLVPDQVGAHGNALTPRAYASVTGVLASQYSRVKLIPCNSRSKAGKIKILGICARLLVCRGCYA